MKKYRLLTAILAVMAILSGCGSNKVLSSTGEIPETGAEETRGGTDQGTERNAAGGPRHGRVSANSESI